MALGTTKVPIVGTAKLIDGDSSVTTTTFGASGFCCSLSSSCWLSGVMSCGGGGAGSTKAGTASSNGGTGWIEMVAGLAPKIPMTRNRMQIELIQASLRFGSRFAAGKQRRAKSSLSS